MRWQSATIEILDVNALRAFESFNVPSLFLFEVRISLVFLHPDVIRIILN